MWQCVCVCTDMYNFTYDLIYLIHWSCRQWMNFFHLIYKPSGDELEFESSSGLNLKSSPYKGGNVIAHAVPSHEVTEMYGGNFVFWPKDFIYTCIRTWSKTCHQPSLPPPPLAQPSHVIRLKSRNCGKYLLSFDTNMKKRYQLSYCQKNKKIKNNIIPQLIFI